MTKMSNAISRFQQCFKISRVFLPVIHVESWQQALRNADTAREAGADGVFLINHNVPAEMLMQVHRGVSDVHRNWFVGVNRLGLSPQLALDVGPKVAGVWTDSKPDVDRVWWPKSCLYFGGVAFKYQRQPAELEVECQAAMRRMDVVTTSGQGTGEPPALEKIIRMRQALGNFPLAIASGITPENVEAYLPYVDAFLVATGISSSFTELDPERVRMLAERVHEFQPEAVAS
jgi:predicted TIM-barrel enzyme